MGILHLDTFDASKSAFAKTFKNITDADKFVMQYLGIPKEEESDTNFNDNNSSEVGCYA